MGDVGVHLPSGQLLYLWTLNTMKRSLFFLALTVCLLAALSHSTTVYAKDTWVSVRTKNFFLLGNAGEKDIRRVGLKLEQFREVFTRLFPKMKFNTPVPTTVVVFKSDSSYRPFKPRANTAGYFQAGPDVNYITLTTELRGEQDPFSVIFHEYTHLLVENTFNNAPLWFNEGLAEYNSTFNITDDQKVALGSHIDSHVYLLRDHKMLPLRTLFQVDEKSPHYNEANKQNIFYAQSWALMHYLIIGKEGRGDQLGKFIDQLNAKQPLEQAFPEAFQTSFEAMEKELREYVKQDRFRVVRGHFEKKLELEAAGAATPLSEAEAQAFLGDLLLHSNRADAYTYLQKAVKLDSNLTMAHASLGMAYFREGKIREAHASLERAVASNSQNYLAHYYYAFTLSRSGPNNGPTIAGYPADVATKIHEHLQKAIALRPDFPESYTLLAFMSLVTGQGIDDSIASLKQLLVSMPGRQDFAFMLGQLYFHKGDAKAARELLEQVVKSNADQETVQRSQQLLTQLRSVEEQLARNEAAKRAIAMNATTVTVSAVETATPEPVDPSSYLREALRKPDAGETQVQGTLVRIDCEAKGIVFVIQTATGLLRLRSATGFEDLAITTYDSSIKGEISCGPRKPENVVIVCYVPNADKKLKVDGLLKSIEFVPSDFKLKP